MRVAEGGAARVWEPGVRIAAAVVAASVAAIFALAFRRGTWFLDAAGRPRFVDFVWLWTGGRFAWSGDAAAAYDPARFAAAQIPLVGAANGHFPYYHWLYPPTLFFVTAPLAAMPYGVAFLVWVAVTLALYLAAVHAILPRLSAVLAAAASYPVAVNLALGHNGLLSAALLGFGLASVRRRPWLAGLCLGLLTYKPQFGLLLPLALLAGREWRAIGWAAGTAILLALAAMAAFGAASWIAFLHSLGAVDPGTLMPDPGLSAVLHSAFGVMRWAGAGIATARAAQLLAALGAAALVWLTWARRDVPYPLKAAMAAAGTLAATPYLLAYDLAALSIPAAFLVQDCLARGFRRGEGVVILGCAAILFLATAAPVGFPVLAALLVLAARRVFVPAAGVTTFASS